MSTHTKGNWKIAPGGCGVISKSDRPICTCGTMDLGQPDNGLAENEANARLIAAAPELLAACEYVIRVAAGEWGKTLRTLHGGLVETVRTATAKAQGEK